MIDLGQEHTMTIRTMTTPTGIASRTDADVNRDRIETAWRDHPYCRDCGQPTTIEARDGGLWIECIALRDLTGIRRALSAAFHERHAIEVSTWVLPAAA
jgi:hypothetical protein